MTDVPLPANRDRVTNRALAICKTIREDAKPEMIRYQKVRGLPQGECFYNVRNHLAKHGGEVVDGWAVWEHPPLLVQAEFHSAWLRPDGVLVDLTPPLHQGCWTTFLRAVDGEVYEGRNKNVVYLPYEESDLAIRFVELSKRWIELVYPEGEIQTSNFVVTPEIMAITREKGEILVQSQKRR